jgi:hypothetical protein
MRFQHGGPPARIVLLIAVGLAILAGAISYGYSLRFRSNAGDIEMPMCMGRALLQRLEPYAHCQLFHGDGVTPTTANPLTTVLLVLPLLPFPPIVAAAIFVGASTGLLSYALARDGYERLLILLAFPYWQAVQVVQWSPLLFAAALMPALLPLTLAKPHIGAPIVLMRLTWRRSVACCALLGVSLLIYPTWPLAMLNHIGAEGEYVPPLFLLPLGPALGLALLRPRSSRAWLLLLLAMAPQRFFYDLFLLWLIPRTRRQIIVLVILSWACYFAWYFWPAGGATWAIALLYLPCLLMVLRDQDEPQAEEEGVLAMGRQLLQRLRGARGATGVQR